MTIKYHCNICGKVGTTTKENPLPNGWLFISIRNIPQGHYLLCEDCKAVSRLRLKDEIRGSAE